VISTWWLVPPLVLSALSLGYALRRGRSAGRLKEDLWRLRSAHAELERRFRRRSDRLDTIFENVDEAILRLDTRGEVLALNNRARRVFRFPERLPLPQPFATLHRNPQWNEALKDALRRLPRSSVLPDVHLGEFVLAARLAPLENGQALLLCLDISRQRQLEAQRERLVREIVHDLKTPLTSILGYARTIEAMGDDASIRRECAAVIVREARRLNRFLTTVLELDPIARSSRSGDERCDPTEVVGELYRRMLPAAEKAGISLHTAVEKDVGLLAMDGGDLSRVLTNLVDNAIRFSPAGGRVCARIRKAPAGIELEVTDDGPGIPPKHLPYVTERFYRVDDSRGSGGHGLGLAIVSEIVSRCGGSLRLRNRPQGGLEVRIRLPTGVDSGKPTP